MEEKKGGSLKTDFTVETIYNYGPLFRETSRFVNLRGKTTPEG
jgi:hypothetical protein